MVKSRKFWFAVQTHYKREIEAKRELEKQGFHVYLPMGGEADKASPLIEGYLFVFECDRWRSINGTRGVQRVLMNDPETPGKVLHEDIQWFKACEDEFGIVRDHEWFAPPKGPRVFSKGEGVVPRSGRFAGLMGSFVQLTGVASVEILYHMMNRAISITHPVEDLA